MGEKYVNISNTKCYSAETCLNNTMAFFRVLLNPEPLNEDIIIDHSIVQ